MVSLSERQINQQDPDIDEGSISNKNRYIQQKEDNYYDLFDERMIPDEKQAERNFEEELKSSFTNQDIKVRNFE